jgi:hypothetical protein
MKDALKKLSAAKIGDYFQVNGLHTRRTLLCTDAPGEDWTRGVQYQVFYCFEDKRSYGLEIIEFLENGETVRKCTESAAWTAIKANFNR